MLFQTYEYLFLLLPASLAVFFFLNRKRQLALGSFWLLASSLFFYGYWKIQYVPLLLASIAVNYGFSRLLSNLPPEKIIRPGRWILGVAIGLDLAVLGYFKYADFFVENLNAITAQEFQALNVILPLAISYFSFQQIGYLVDSWRGETRDHTFLEYTVFVSFFPQLIVGPIVNHKDVIHQFRSLRGKIPNYRNLATGSFLTSVGLFKKVIFADYLGRYAERGFSDLEQLSTLEAWMTSLAGNFQIYFDFSGYTDMAIGAALMFNIRLPDNFRSPYAATNIQEHWRRWHITLSRFFLTYVYIPLGGSKKGESLKMFLILCIFLLSGIWHGAGWTFVFWGFLHGLGLVSFKLWEKVGIDLPPVLAWLINFNFVNITRVFFRSATFEDALDLLRRMVGIGATETPTKELFESARSLFEIHGDWFLWSFPGAVVLLLTGLLAVKICFKDSSALERDYEPTPRFVLATIAFAVLALLTRNETREFLYFQF